MKIGFKNFKSFSDDHELSLGNFNVITGKNNAGKSSLSDLIYYYLLLKNKDIDQHPLINASAAKIIRLTTAWKVESFLNTAPLTISGKKASNSDQEDLTEKQNKNKEEPIKLYDEESKLSNLSKSRRRLFDPINFFNILSHSYDKQDYILGKSNFEIYATHTSSLLGPHLNTGPSFNDNHSISMSYKISADNVDHKLNQESKGKSFRDYIGDTMAKKEGLLVHRNLISCDCDHTEDLFYQEAQYQLHGKRSKENISYVTPMSHEEFFKQRLKDKKFYLTDLIKLDCFDDDIKKAITTALDQTAYNEAPAPGPSSDSGDPLDYIEFVYDNTLTLLKATKSENLFIEGSPMITSEQCKRIIDTLKENIFCYNDEMDISKDCIKCETCRYNVQCINEPINYHINEYIHNANNTKNYLKKDLEKYDKAKFIFSPEFNGISFGKQSPPFLEGLLLAKIRGTGTESLISFGANQDFSGMKSSLPTGRQMKETVERLKAVVFQEKLQEIDSWGQNPTFQMAKKLEVPNETDFLSNMFFLPKDPSEDVLQYQITFDIEYARKDLRSPYFENNDTPRSITPSVLLALIPADPFFRYFDILPDIYPKFHIFSDILFSKYVSEPDKRMIFGDVFIDQYKKLSFTKKNYQKEFDKYLENNSEFKNLFTDIIAMSSFTNNYSKKKQFVVEYVHKWKNNDPIGKKYQKSLIDRVIQSSIGNWKTNFSVGCKKESEYKKKAIVTMPMTSPYMASISESHGRFYKEEGNKKNILNQFIPRIDLDNNIRIAIHNRPENEAIVDIDYGSINEWKRNKALQVTMGGPGPDFDMPDPDNSINYPWFDNITIKTTHGKKIYYKNKKINYFPPTVGPLFHIDSQFGFDLLEHGKIGDNISDLEKEEFKSRRENLLNALGFLEDVKLDKIFYSLDINKLKDGIIDINPTLGKDIISVEKFKNLLNADSYDIPYSSLSILAVYSRIVRDILKDLNFSVMELNKKQLDFIHKLNNSSGKEREKLEKTAAAKQKIKINDLFLSKISPAVTKKVAKKYKIRQKDVAHQAQVILMFILMKLINRFEKTAYSLIQHDYLKQLKNLEIDLLPEDLLSNDKCHVEIINPVVWKPYHEGIKRSDSNSASFDEIKTFLGREFHSHLSSDMKSNRKSFSDTSDDGISCMTSQIIIDINKSLKAVGTDLTFTIRPIFSKEVEYINDEEENSQAKFTGNFKMFVSSKSVESPLDKTGEGISALISIFARIHSNTNFRTLLLSDVKKSLIVSIIREPENHLHPNFIAKLIEHIFDLSKANKKEPLDFVDKIVAQKGFAKQRIFILETHSEVVLRQTQASIKKHSSKNKNLESLVKVYYVDQKSVKEDIDDKRRDKSVIKDLKLKNNGFFDRDIPKGFFDINTNLIADLWKDDYKPKKKVKK